MVDALYNLSVPEALALARAIDPFDIHFFEPRFGWHRILILSTARETRGVLTKELLLVDELGDRTCARRR